jgi:hypothetical protein
LGGCFVAEGFAEAAVGALSADDGAGESGGVAEAFWEVGGRKNGCGGVEGDQSPRHRRVGGLVDFGVVSKR